MKIQMSSRYCGRSPYLPDDCSECGSCGNPHLGYGLCRECNRRLIELDKKLLEDNK